MIKIKHFIKLSEIALKNLAKFSSKNNIFSNVGQSSHYKPIVKVQQFLNNLAIDYRTGSSAIRIKQCVFCTKPHYNDLTNLYTLNVNKDNGLFYCHRCASKGSWSQLQAKYLNTQANQISSLMSQQFGQNILKTQLQMPLSDAEYFLYIKNLQNQQYLQVLQYIKSKGIKQQTINKFMIGAGSQTFISQQGKPKLIKCIYFPMFQLVSRTKKKGLDAQYSQKTLKSVQVTLVKAKIRGGSDQNKKYERSFPMGPKMGFFGLNTVSEKDSFIVITQDQISAMSVHQNTGFAAISLPKGSHNVPQQLISYLDQFQKIVLWMDNDEAGGLAEDKLSYKLGSSRTYVVRNDLYHLKNANDVLLQAPHSMKQLIQKSRTKPGQNIITFPDIQQSIRNRIFKHEQFIGIKIDWLPFFNRKVKGIRMQQVTIVSGPTGCGKTTFLTQLSLDLCKKQIPVLWGSFQIKNQVLVTNMLIQYSGVNLFKNKQMFQFYSQQFKRLPLYYLSFQGTNDVQKVLAAIQYSIQKNNVSFVVLDTLQFLLSDQAQGYKKFDLQDKVLSRLRKIATNFNVHIAIVIHPRKVQDNEDIQINAIYGTSKATQEADNVWILQSRSNFRILDIKKNRYDGQLGRAALGYDKLTKSFFQLTKPELSSLFHNQSTIEQIIQKRSQNSQKNQTKEGEKEQDQNIQQQNLVEQKRRRSR